MPIYGYLTVDGMNGETTTVSIRRTGVQIVPSD